ncbi:hypothetical protein PSHT_04371 [Puccinia striiformis]|uniref:GTP cyclohydrolase II n=1 Tax=Puccinia striiformis TaxID=27350 RepID=A0A2S4WDC5_9BASI|nr:hypothetical protein PSHT_04371 [Puccinia striiformis]
MADSLVQSETAKTNELLQHLITEVRGLKESQTSLELKMETLGLSFPSPYTAHSNLDPEATGGLLSGQSSTAPPVTESHHLSTDSRSIPVPVTMGPSRSSSSSRSPKHGGAYENEGSMIEKARFVEWMKTERSLLGNDTQSSDTVGKQKRGPVVASRHPLSLKIRPYCIYKALATAIGAIDPNHRPDYTNTQPPFAVPPNPSWFDPSKIVSMDPWGHLAPELFKSYFDSGVDIRPTVACTKAHLKLAELDEAVAQGNLLIDGKIVVKSPGTWAAAAAQTAVESAGGKWESLSEEERHILTSKQAGVEVQWNLPGVAARFNISEAILRRALFEDTGGMYPELLTRSDLKTYLPPDRWLDRLYLRDPSKELTLRVHDECNGSDVFGSSICTCRPYLLYGIEEAIKCAQRGGSGVIVYFRKEGRALGEVTKYLVYNARKRGGDSAAFYFQRTESVAGVKDMRFQALMPDVLHWLGIKKIDVMCSMSDMKHDAIVQSGIPILLRKDIPDHLIPSDSRVEIDAKIAAGYFSASKVVTEEDLKNTVGQSWGRC